MLNHWKRLRFFYFIRSYDKQPFPLVNGICQNYDARNTGIYIYHFSAQKFNYFAPKSLFVVSKCLMRNKSFQWEMYHNKVTMLTIPSFNYSPFKSWGNLRHVNFFFVVVWHNLAPQFLKLFWYNNATILHLPKTELFYYIMKVLGHVRNISFTIAAYFLLQI